MKNKGLLPCVLAVCLALVLMAGAPAAGAEQQVLQLDKKDCSLTLVFGDGKSDLDGGTIALYRVAGIKYTGEKYVYNLSTGQFKGVDAAKPIPGLSQKELDSQNAALAAALEKEADSSKLKPLKTAAIIKGKASFTNLRLGLYLVRQTKAAAKGLKITSFLISIPDGEGKFDIVAAPKTGLPPSPPVTTPPVTTPPHVTTTPHVSNPPPGDYTPGLPQTGQLWWPVPVLAALGLALIAAGLLLRCRRTEE